MAATDGGGEVDLLEHLERKRQEVASIQEAAEVAREQALALLRLQRRVAEIDAMAEGDDGAAAQSSIAGASASAAGGAGSASATSSSAKPAPGALTGAEGVGSLEASSHPHPLARSGNTEEWICDGCRRASALHAGMERYHCACGCDFDLCGGCHAAARLQGLIPASSGAEGVPGRGGQMQVSAPLPAMVPGSSLGGSSLSAEDRRRFGLDDGFERGGSRGGTGGTQRSRYRQPEADSGWTSLSEEDRRRFGLDAAAGVPHRPEQPAPAPSLHIHLHGAAASAPSRKPTVVHHPDVLWGSSNDGSRASLGRTLAQLEAVGANSQILADLQESERQLQILKLQG